ncbi:hypothetical protein ACFQLX_23945 [Streptomyces polyrhachis]|uniref:Uncharacterized protein n=1 Tax=Streptomyces polyrhachis TaxID=1282885 RepID=A0ABW2GQ42_9ACTN
MNRDMTLPTEARRLCLNSSTHEAAARFEQQGIDADRLENLLHTPPTEREKARTELVELHDAWNRSTDMVVHVPEQRTAQPHGLLIALHGVGGTGEKVALHLQQLADTCGAILLAPTAKRPVLDSNNLDLAGIRGREFSEARWTYDPGDFPLQALAWGRKNLNIDVDRCGLVGTSMGAIAVWNITSRYWDRWSMAAPINGAPSMWEIFGPDRVVRKLLRNLTNVPLCAVHGQQDRQIPAALDKEAVDYLRSIGHPEVSFVGVAQGEHNLSTMDLQRGQPQFERIAELYRQARRPQWPSKLRHFASSGDSGRAHWLALEGITQGKIGSFKACVSDRAKIDLSVTNAARTRVFLSSRLVDPGQVLITLNDATRVVNFKPTLLDTVKTYVDAGADPALMAQMVVELDVPEIPECEDK